MQTQFLAFLLAMASVAAADAGIMLSVGSPTYSQNFDSLASSGTSSVVPDGWALSETGTSANLVYTAGTGSLATGDTYSFGSVGSTDRALGELTSGTLNSTFGASFINAGSTRIESLGFAYTGEQWRLGFLGRTDQLNFQYSLNATSLTTGIWIDLNALDFVAPVSTGSVGSLDGNLLANQTLLSNSLSGLDRT